MARVLACVVLAASASCARSSLKGTLSAGDVAAANARARQFEDQRRRCRQLEREAPSPEAVRQVGAAMMAQWFDGGAVSASTRLDRVVGRLDAGLSFSARVVSSGAAETFSIPPGEVFVTSGLLEVTASDEALAGFVAHEVGHLARGDVVRLVQREAVSRCEFQVMTQEMAQLSSSPDTRLATMLPDAGMSWFDERPVVDMVIRSLRQVGFGESPQDVLLRERAADEHALGLLRAARIDSGPWEAALASTPPVTVKHPSPEVRLEALARLKEQWPSLPAEPARRSKKKR